MDDDYFTNNRKLRQEVSTCWQMIESLKEDQALAQATIVSLNYTIANQSDTITQLRGVIADRAIEEWEKKHDEQ